MNFPKRKTIVTEQDGFRPKAELEQFHTIDLVYVLGYMRQERRSAYSTMYALTQVQNKSAEFKKAANEAYTYYKDVTDRTKFVERLLAFRKGYVPKQVTQQLVNQEETAYLEAIS